VGPILSERSFYKWDRRSQLDVDHQGEPIINLIELGRALGSQRCLEPFPASSFHFSYDVCLLRCCGNPFKLQLPSKRGREIRENPIVFQGVIDNPEELAGQGDDGTAGSASADTVVVVR
jgi:hypothetical protein